MDSKLRHSGRFYIKLKVDEGSKLGDLFLTNNPGGLFRFKISENVSLTKNLETSQVEAEHKNDESNEAQLWSFANNKIRCLMTNRSVLHK